MKLLEACKVQETGMRRPMQFDPIKVSMDAGQTGVTNCRGFNDQKEYYVKAEIACIFWANAAQKEIAQKEALHLLQREVYSDLWPHVNRLRGALASTDIYGALYHLDKLIEEMEP